MILTLRIQNSAGEAITGASPSFLHFKDITDLSNQSDLTPQPTIYEIGNGIYGFDYDFKWKVVNFVIDCGASAWPRYQSGTIDARAEYTLVNKMRINESASKLEIWDESGSNKICEFDLTDASDGTIDLENTKQPCNRGVPSAT